MMPQEFGQPYLKEDEVHVRLPSSAMLYLHTDGLVETRTEAGEECGLGGLVGCMEESMAEGGDPGDILDRLLAKGYGLAADDCTLMNLRRIPAAELLACGERALTMEDADQLSAALAECLSRSGWDEMAVTMVRLLITEHLANVVKHGRCPAEKKLFYRLTATAKGCVLVLSDPDMAWDPDHWREEKANNPERFAESGRGLGTIVRICERQRHFRRDNYNHAVYTLNRDLVDRLNDEFSSEAQGS